MQCNMLSSALSQEFPCNRDVKRNLAAEAGGEVQLGVDTKQVTKEGAGYNVGLGHSYWIVSNPPAGELP